MKYLLLLCLLAGPAYAVNNPCPQTSGGLTAPAFVSRTSGISPLLVFFDNGGVASAHVTANMSAFQDVISTWDSGDTLGSGNSTWSYGSNAGHNLRRYGAGNEFAHLYVTEGRDTWYTATVTSSDGTDQVSCSLSIHVFDPNGVNGWPGAATTCISGSGDFTGCPASANHVTSNTISLIGANLSNKRLLYHCGETYSGTNVNITGTKWDVGAYGSPDCSNTKTNRPIFLDNSCPSSPCNHIHIAQAGGSPGATDGRIHDIALQSSGGNAAVASDQADNNYIKQITIYNIDSAHPHGMAYWSSATETGLIDSVQSVVMTAGFTVFVNTAENVCVNGNHTLNCTPGSAQYVPVNYNAVLGNSIPGCATCSATEVVRVSACRMCVIEDNTITGAGGGVSNLKFHDGSEGSAGPWLGQYNEDFVISRNLFTPTGTTGGAQIEVAPQNGGLDERIRFGVIEDNIMGGNSNGQGYVLCWISGQNITLRDNMFRMDSVSNLIYPQAGCQTDTRGGGNFSTWQTQGIEVLNNSGVVTGSPQSPQNLILNGGSGPGGTLSVYKNNIYFTSNNQPTIGNVVGGNTISNNTVNSNVNPGFVNASGNFTSTTDWKPTANFTGGVSVPVKYDATLSSTNPYGITWSPTWDLGAIHH